MSGYSVSLSADGTRVAIGAPYNDGSFDGAGHVRVYSWDGSAWTQVGPDIDGEAAWDSSGHSVSLSADGSRVAIGAHYNGDGIGHVRVYSSVPTSLSCGAGTEANEANECVPTSGSPANCAILRAAYNSGAGCC